MIPWLSLHLTSKLFTGQAWFFNIALYIRLAFRVEGTAKRKSFLKTPSMCQPSTANERNLCAILLDTLSEPQSGRGAPIRMLSRGSPNVSAVCAGCFLPEAAFEGGEIACSLGVGRWNIRATWSWRATAWRRLVCTWRAPSHKVVEICREGGN